MATFFSCAKLMKKATLSIAAVIAIYIVVGQGAVYSQTVGTSQSVRVHNYDNWYFLSDETTDRSMMIMTVAHRDIVCYLEEWSVNPRELKAVNPNVKVYRVWSTMKNVWESDWGKLSPDPTAEKLQTPLFWQMIETNDWWLRDGNGNKVDDAYAGSSEPGNSWYLDLGKPGLKEAYLKTVLERMKEQGFDGVVFDGAMQYLTTWLRGRPFPTQLYSNDDDWYKRAWQPFMQYVVSGLKAAGYRVVQNCGGEYGTTDPKEQWNRSQVDGVIYEQFAIDWPSNGANWLPGAVIERRIKACNLDPLEVWADDYGLENTLTDFDRKRLVSLAMYYVSIPALQSRHSYNYINNRKVFWDILWDFYIGTPAKAAVKMSGKYFWSREYTKGLVLLNYESSVSIKYTLKRKYVDPNGRVWSKSILLGPHTGMILKNR